MRILGIDPGIDRVGWGVVDVGKTLVYRGCGCIRTNKNAPDEERIQQISKELRELIKKARPQRVHVEKLFFAKNKKTALRVAQSRGAILLTLQVEKIQIEEFTPLEVKLSLTGNGRAEKQQVAWMVKNILKISGGVTSDDALDALALCIVPIKKLPSRLP